MSKDRTSLGRLYLLAVPVVLAILSIGAALVRIQWLEADQLEDRAALAEVRPIDVPAARGNILSADGMLLATSMPTYTIHFDPVVVEKSRFEDEIEGLCSGLHRVLGGRSAPQWESILRRARTEKRSYVPIARDVPHETYRKLGKLPLFERGKIGGGFIVVQSLHRFQPLGGQAARTIGTVREQGASGLEQAYSEWLSGRKGSRLAQRIGLETWKPLTDYNEVEPEDGYDVVSTLDSRIQDLTHTALLRTLERFEADHGCAVVMEVQTGAIRAMANLGRTQAGKGYYEARNYAVWESTEPGSTFKLVSLMSALEDGRADTALQVETGDGVFVVHSAKIKDSNVEYGNGGYGRISLGRAFELSSNTGIAKVVYQAYQKDPAKLVDRWYALGLNRPLGLEIEGEGQPRIPRPGQPGWSGTTLPWMTFGYELSFTPLQILTVYNAIANGGRMVKPRFVERVERAGETVETFSTEVLNASICSEKTRQALHDLLARVVERGTAENIQIEGYPLAGKTGTCQLNYWKGAEARSYQSSFVGYFPADQPRYACIVVVQQPNPALGYYGSTVAAPVFREIALGLRRYLPSQAAPSEAPTHVAPRPRRDTDRVLAQLNGSVTPQMRGMRVADALALLENSGHRVELEGTGALVSGQWPESGSPLRPQTRVKLTTR
ncbi:PASTA domain-containing protein [bacterium]|nr:PASTA domain-containing protein [bacterium]